LTSTAIRFAAGTNSQQLHALGHYFDCKEVDTSGIAAGSIEARDQPLLYRVTTRTEHDRDCRGRRLGCERGGRATRRDDHAHLTTYEISR